MILQIQEQRLAGSTGCNRLVGTYALTGDHLRLSPARADDDDVLRGV